MQNLIIEMQDLRHLRWDERSTTSGTSGTFPKTREDTDAARLYYKLSCYDSYRGVYGHECVNELIAARVMEHLGIPHAGYKLIHALVSIDDAEHEVWLNESISFRAKDERKIAFDLYYDLNKIPGESPFDFIKRMGWGEEIAAMIVLDFLIANRDRHGANIEIIRDQNGEVRLAPFFDNGLSFVFSCYADEKRAAKFEALSDVNANNYFGTRSLEENLTFLNELVSIPISFPSINDEVIEGFTEGLHQIISDTHIKKIQEILRARWNYLLEHNYIKEANK